MPRSRSGQTSIRGPVHDPVRRHNLAFALDHLPSPPCRVLEVGCGEGELAADLREHGYDVQALDRDPEAVAVARSRGVEALAQDFLTFEAEPFEAVLFTRSLHHIAPLDRALRRADALLVEGGALLADEFDFESMDHPTAVWFYGLHAVLTACGVILDGNGHPGSGARERWLHAHGHDPPLSPGREMERRIERRFDLHQRAEVGYLYRYFHVWMGENALRDTVVEALFTSEREMIRTGTIRALGRQWVARKPVRDG